MAGPGASFSGSKLESPQKNDGTMTKNMQERSKGVLPGEI